MWVGRACRVLITMLLKYRGTGVKSATRGGSCPRQNGITSLLLGIGLWLSMEARLHEGTHVVLLTMLLKYWEARIESAGGGGSLACQNGILSLASSALV